MSVQIAQAQTALNRLMGAGLVADGKYGPKTREALKSFQRQRGLRVDGLFGPQTYRALGIVAGPAPKTPPVPVGGLIARENQPPQETTYFRIPHGGEGPAPAMTAVFYPKDFRASAPLDVIVYLQGHHRDAGSQANSIQRYLSGKWDKKFLLREELNDTAKNVVLIAPTLGPRSEAGSLVTSGGFERYLDQVFDAMAKEGPFKNNRPELRNLVLACHSGGGSPMRTIARGLKKYASNLKECWGFDCLYSSVDPSQWAEWGKANPDKRLYVYWAWSTSDLSKALAAKKVPNIEVAKSSTTDHNSVPITYWKTRILGFRP